MADEENANPVAEEEEEEEWLDPADVDGLPDGLATTFVGGWSLIKTLADAIEGGDKKRKLQPGDRIVLLPGTYDSDAILDTAALRGVTIVGDANVAPSEVAFTGQLALKHTPPTADAAANKPPADDDAPPPPPPAPLAIGNMTFLGGAIVAELTDADVNNCVFGAQHVDPAAAGGADDAAAARVVTCHAFSTVRFSKSRIYGAHAGGVYGFPYTRAQFLSCDIVGCDKPPVKTAEAKSYRKKVAAPPAAVVPTVPAQCEAEVGVELDNAEASFTDCTISNFTIGVHTRDACKKGKFERCAVAQIATVGFLVGTGSSPILRGNKVKLCGRECLVVGNKAHPSVRDNIFVGDVRLKADAVTTGICDNVVGNNGLVIEDSTTYSRRGFTVVATDPTAVKVKKVAAE